MTDHRDLVIQELADRERDLFEANRQLIALIADLSFENATLRTMYGREFVCRVHADATIRRLQHLVYQQRMAA